MGAIQYRVLEAPLAALDELAARIIRSGKVWPWAGPTQLDVESIWGDPMWTHLRALGYQDEDRDDALSALAASIRHLYDLVCLIEAGGIALSPEQGAELGWKWVAVGAPMLTVGYAAGSIEASVPVGKPYMLRTRILFAAPELGVFTTLYFKPDGGGSPLSPAVVSLEYSGVWGSWCVVLDDLVSAHERFLHIVPDEHARRCITREQAMQFAAAMAATLHDSLR